MKYLALLILLSIGISCFAQKKYFAVKDSNRIELLQQDVKKNFINVGGFIQADSLLRQPTFKPTAKGKLLTFPLDTAKNFEIELDVKLDKSKGAIKIWGASRKDIKKPALDKEEDILYQMDFYSDGIYNILRKTFGGMLIGIGGLKKIEPADPDSRRITIRKRNKDVEFYVNKNLILVILPPGDINEIGVVIEGEGIQIEKIMINYLTN